MASRPIRLTPRTLIVPKRIGFVAVPDYDNPDYWGIITHVEPYLGDPFRFVLDEETIPGLVRLFRDEVMKTGSAKLKGEFSQALFDIVLGV